MGRLCDVGGVVDSYAHYDPGMVAVVRSQHDWRNWETCECHEHGCLSRQRALRAEFDQAFDDMKRGRNDSTDWMFEDNE